MAVKLSEGLGNPHYPLTPPFTLAPHFTITVASLPAVASKWPKQAMEKCLQDKNNPTRPASMPQTERRFVKFGGGFGEAQLAWLRAELQVQAIQK